MSIAQCVFDLSLRIMTSGPRRAGLGTLASFWRRVLISLGDPHIEYEHLGFPIELPLSHQLPYYRASYPEYGLNLARLAGAVSAKYPGASVVDIGANVGDTAATVRSACSSPVLCIEGDDQFCSILRRNAGRIPDVHVEQTLVGDSDRDVEAALVTHQGTGRLVSTTGCGVRVERLETVLSRWSSLPLPHLVKIDTDGFDCPIITGSLQTLTRLRPVLFFEYDPDFLPGTFEPVSFFSGLRGAGYDRLIVYENTGSLLVSLRTSDTQMIEDLHAYFSGRQHAKYADIAAFPAEDDDLASSFRALELTYFSERAALAGA